MNYRDSLDACHRCLHGFVPDQEIRARKELEQRLIKMEKVVVGARLVARNCICLLNEKGEPTLDLLVLQKALAELE